MEISTTVDKLEYKHNDYVYYANYWTHLRNVQEGAIAFVKNAALYMPQRPGEELAIWQARVAKMTFTPVMSTAIREFVAELVSAPHSLEYQNDKDFWERFKTDNNTKGRDESELLHLLLTNLLYYGRVSVGCVNPNTEDVPRNLAEQEQLKITPSAYIYQPHQVLNWGDGWAITKQVVNVTKPKEPHTSINRWIQWDTEAYEVYEKRVDDNSAEVRGIRTEHNLGVCPFKTLVLGDEFWVGNNVLLKQLQHFLLENNWTDAGSIAGIVQRLIKPRSPVERDAKKLYADEVEDLDYKTGNPYTIIADDYKFVESPGTAIANLTGQLDKIEAQIKELVSKSNNQVANKGVVEQSGVAKAFDRIAQAKTMMAYGQKVAQVYQDIIDIVAKLGGINPATFSGLNSYGSDTLRDLLQDTETMQPFFDKIPPTALKLWFGRISNLLASSKSAEIESEIIKELDRIFDLYARQAEKTNNTINVGPVNSTKIATKTTSN